ncbi:MAG: RIP metalloprotease RseP [Xanthobacteraceae bacterium]|jgi:regulator of sigma E protease
MDMLAGIGAWAAWSTLYQAVAVVLVFSVVVFFHELGHFWVARRCGVRVLVFSIGFGRELVGFNDRYGTRWKISAVPLGGYVKFFGDENAASVPDAEAINAMSEDERRDSFFHKPVRVRAAVVAAGPIANFILAIVIFAGVFMVFGKQETAARVDEIIPDSAAAAAGFRPGDVVLSIEGRPIESFSDMQRIVSVSAGQPLEFAVERSGERVTLRAVPTLKEEKDPFGIVHRIGQLGIKRSIAPGDVKTYRVGPLAAVQLGIAETWNVVERTLSYVTGVVAGRESADQLSGPVGIVRVTGKVAVLGFGPLMQLAAMLSVSIGLLNLFPIPLLDGGHLLFYAIEAIRGRPMSERAQEIGFRIGLAIVLMLMIFATYNDILHLASS